ncbi:MULTISPECIES: HlyD family type I secretion periplasmic adaptor subunit [Agrobacterium]|uniref:Membrane fusion protein (MFP) family protein n=1 Tax=Agrobacterium rosae TaxID=1972867 RepID=A0A1R3TIB5_9HYPH|nr:MULTISPECIES: HlyD family type I secretion periplasmic adaptor subunit [Agrobacterium]KAA3515491.1 HlyD family type I secretion periplasmic adaptor subunit [Agrobacterium rosae]KAA3524457.1 HlyD family type I secretion periplasmic adaptor subunit [Agrobacterium rosae]MCM2431365.1 HlyD family type I secretion periplasmic adaptor subunit [Agrobacterium rosae]MDX8302332.1 HlyD family type I secretion periplasmic adaptor subunit [Agrobacterium rosae]MDX8312613.1 HlyD family type I secretion per
MVFKRKQKQVEQGQLEWYSEVPRSIRMYSVTGLAVLFASFGGFGYWAGTAPLASAIIAQGSFVATGNNKIIQHLEGGIIKEMMVSEGQVVKEGDVLVVLDKTAALSNQKMINLKRLRLETIVYRLRAEAQGEKTFKVPDIVMAEASDPDVNAIIQGQNVVFHSKQIKLEEQLNLVEKNIRSLEFRFIGYKGQKSSFERQQSLLEQERDSKAKLAKDGVIRKTDMLALERAIADAMGDISRLDGEMNQSEAEIAKFRQEAVIAVNSNKQAALDALETAEADLDGVRQQLREASQILDRTVIRSPVNGTVIRSYYHTAGGVITTGKPIMEILPAHVPLILEAQVLRTSIDQLHEGQTAAIRLSALNRRTTPVLDGKVFYVSADSIEENAGMQVKDVYIVRVQISDEELAKVHGFHPVPGMPADVLIQTSERTFFEYLTKPIADSMSRAFKER